MRKCIAIFFLLFSLYSSANNPYRNYLLSKISLLSQTKASPVVVNASSETSCLIPHFERPKGAVFCRMEDYLTAKTKVWIKIGVK